MHSTRASRSRGNWDMISSIVTIRRLLVKNIIKLLNSEMVRQDLYDSEDKLKCKDLIRNRFHMKDIGYLAKYGTR